MAAVQTTPPRSPVQAEPSFVIGDIFEYIPTVRQQLTEQVTTAHRSALHYEAFHELQGQSYREPECLKAVLMKELSRQLLDALTKVEYLINSAERSGKAAKITPSQIAKFFGLEDLGYRINILPAEKSWGLLGDAVKEFRKEIYNTDPESARMKKEAFLVLVENVHIVGTEMTTALQSAESELRYGEHLNSYQRTE